MSTVILTRPLSAGSGLPGTVVTNISVPTTNTVTVESCPVSTSVSVKWIYTVMDQTLNTVVSAEVLATHRDGTNPTHTRYAIIGDVTSIQHAVNVVIIGSNICLQITNNHTNELKCNVVRIQIIA